MPAGMQFTVEEDTVIESRGAIVIDGDVIARASGASAGPDAISLTLRSPSTIRIRGRILLADGSRGSAQRPDGGAGGSLTLYLTRGSGMVSRIGGSSLSLVSRRFSQ